MKHFSELVPHHGGKTAGIGMKKLRHCHPMYIDIYSSVYRHTISGVPNQGKSPRERLRGSKWECKPQIGRRELLEYRSSSRFG